MGISLRKLFRQSFEGHKGIPGKQGGSLPRGEGSSKNSKTMERSKRNPNFSPPKEDYEIVAHVTRKRNVPSILQGGLKSSGQKDAGRFSGGTTSGAVFFWTDIERDDSFSNWSSSKESIILFAVPKKGIQGGPGGTQAAAYRGDIPAEWIYGVISN